MLLLALVVFVAAVVIDAADALYTRAVTAGDAHRAALYSVAMYCIGCVGFFAVLEVSWWLMVPEVAGMYLGTLLAVRRGPKVDTAGERGIPPAVSLSARSSR